MGNENGTAARVFCKSRRFTLVYRYLAKIAWNWKLGTVEIILLIWISIWLLLFLSIPNLEIWDFYVTKNQLSIYNYKNEIINYPLTAINGIPISTFLYHHSNQTNLYVQHIMLRTFRKDFCPFSFPNILNIIIITFMLTRTYAHSIHIHSHP